MGFGNIFKRYILPGLAVAGAPFSGGTSLLGMAGVAAPVASGIAAAAGAGSAMLGGGGPTPTGTNTAGEVGQVLGDTAAGRAEGRAKDIDYTLKGNDQEMARARLADTMVQNKYGNQMDQFKLGTTLPDLRASQAVRGNLLANVQDVTSSHPRANIVHFGGGLRPSALGPEAREAGRKLAQEGVSHLGNESMPAIPDATPFKLTDLPQENAVDKILSIAGPAASLAGIFARKPSPTSPGAPAAPSLPGALEPPGTVNLEPAGPPEAQPIPSVTTKWGVSPTPPPGGINFPWMNPAILGNDLPSQGGISGQLPRPGVPNSGAQRFLDLMKGVRF